MTEDSPNVFNRGLDYIHKPYLNFIRGQRAASLLLLIATAIALSAANSDYFLLYQDLVFTPIGFYFDSFRIEGSLNHIMNDGLMVLFFFLIGLEIKREILSGDLVVAANRNMLVLCAVGGMLCPALVYSIFNWSLDSQNGFGIPMATDTAFALGVLMVVRKHIPVGLPAFIVGLAIVDDIGAILVIAIFYTQQIYVVYLAGAIATLTFMFLANHAGIKLPLFYIVFGFVVWWMVLQSGVHPSSAGVLIALTVPARPKVGSANTLAKAKRLLNALQRKAPKLDMLGSRENHDHMLEVRDFAENATTPLRRWEDALHVPVAFFILPLFALTNAGIFIDLSTLIDDIRQPVGLGIVAGLIVGKFVGISGACWLTLRFKLGSLPAGIGLQHIIGVSLIAGIGFTMSTFIAVLGFDLHPENLHIAKTAVIVASIISASLGLLYFILLAKYTSDNTPELTIPAQ